MHNPRDFTRRLITFLPHFYHIFILTKKVTICTIRRNQFKKGYVKCLLRKDLRFKYQSLSV
jgi:hypothetical protein